MRSGNAEMSPSWKFVLTAAVMIALTIRVAPAQEIIYVDADAAGLNDGSTWADAFVHLQDALAAAVPSQHQIWVARGMYYPDRGQTLTPDDRNTSFHLKHGVSVYGGFNGWETSVDERDADRNRSILSGNIGDPDSDDDNSFTVVVGTTIGRGTTLDGFIIRDANNDNPIVTPSGGGMRLDGESAITLRNLTIADNRVGFDVGIGYGGGIYTDGVPDLYNVRFVGNRAGLTGGGMYVVGTPYTSHITFRKVVFEGNGGSYGGGGLSIAGARTPYFEDVKFIGNGGGKIAGGGMLAAGDVYPTMVDCLFEGNRLYWFSIKGGGISMGSGSLENVTFRDNSVKCMYPDASCIGGGMFTNGSPILRNVTFEGNASTGAGAGMHAAGGRPVLTDVTFIANKISEISLIPHQPGAGLYVDRASPVVVGAEFMGNESGSGSAVAVSSRGSVSLVNAVFSGNEAVVNAGGALLCEGSCEVINSTFSGNAADSGRAIAVTGTLDIANSILWGASALVVDGGTAAVAFTTIEGGLPPGVTDLGGNDDLDPLFVDPAGPDGIVGTIDDNLRLSETSPLHDAGSNTLLPSDVADADEDGDTTEPLPIDRDGNPRIIEWATLDVDKGAYEGDPSLPIEFVSVRATVDGYRVTLRWETATSDAESAVSHFNVFEIATRPAIIGTTSAAVNGHAYSFIVDSVAVGKHVYELVAVLTDGTRTPSEQVEVMVNSGEAFGVSNPWPNPASSVASIRVVLQQSQSVTGELYDMRGKLVARLQSQTVDSNEPRIVTIDVSTLANGPYLLRMRSDWQEASRMIVVSH